MARNFKTPAVYTNLFREKTRAQIADENLSKAIKLPVSLACVHLCSDSNLGFLIRAAACFGASEVLVIGKLPSYRNLRQLSCGMNNYMTIKQFSNPNDFLQYNRERDTHIVSLELTKNSVDITNYEFPLDKKVCIITGNESTGVPSSIIHNSDCVAIPNPGIAPCMNTSQAANVALYEYVRQAYRSN